MVPDQTVSNSLRYGLNDSPSDAVQILQFLERVNERYLRSPFIREFTVSLMGGMDNNDVMGQAQRVIDFVRSNLTYIRDPVDSEYVISPVKLLQDWQTTGKMFGDCEDHVLLLNSMLGSIGIPTKFVGVKFGNTDVFNHVVSGVEVSGQLHVVDPCAKNNAQPYYKETLLV